METSGPTSGIPRLLATTTQTTTGQWQIGQLLQATVTGNSAGKVLLAIGNRQVSAETSLPLEKGQQLTLQVRSLGEQPVLKIRAATGATPLSTAIRMLLPRQGSMTPLLANMAGLAHAPNPPTPLLLNQLVRSMVGRLPDIKTVSSADGLRKAINNSGVFLERQLILDPAQSSASGPMTLHADFKANLLRLVQLVRNWPGGSGQTSAPGQSTPAAASAPGAPPGVPPAMGQAAPTGSTAGSVNPPAASAGAAAPGTSTAPPSAAQIQRAVQPPPLSDRPASAGTAITSGALQGATTAAGATGSATPASPAITAPPLRGSVPVPQSATQVSLDLLNRMGNFRTDLLQQAEAALARIQMHQLAALPREGERGLLEWLFELPIRRGDAIDLWSLRVFRDPADQQQEDRQQEQNWSLQLAFDLPGLGPMQAQVQLSGATVSTRFWAEQPDTLPLLRAHLHELRQALGAAGLEVGDLECQPAPMPNARPTRNEPLINEKA